MKLKAMELQVLRSLKVSLRPFEKELISLEKREAQLTERLATVQEERSIINSRISSIKDSVLNITGGVSLDQVNFETGTVGEFDDTAVAYETEVAQPAPVVSILEELREGNITQVQAQTSMFGNMMDALHTIDMTENRSIEEIEE